MTGSRKRVVRYCYIIAIKKQWLCLAQPLLVFLDSSVGFAATSSINRGGLKSFDLTILVLLMIRGQCETVALLATTGALAPQRSPVGPCHVVTEE